MRVLIAGAAVVGGGGVADFIPKTVMLEQAVSAHVRKFELAV